MKARKSDNNLSKEDIMEEGDLEFRNTSSKRCKCWGAGWFITLTVFAWILGAGALGLAGYCGIKGKSAKDKYLKLKSQDDEVLGNLKKAEDDIQVTNKKIEDIDQQITKDKAELSLLKDDYNKTYTKYVELSEELGKLNTELKKVLEDVLEFKKENERLTKENEEAIVKIKALKEELEQIKRDIVTYASEKKIFIFSAALNGLGSAFFIIDIIYELRQIEKLTNLIENSVFQLKSFNKVVDGYINYELFKKSTGKEIKRSICSKGPGKKDLESCLNKNNTITTITAKGGYRFGAVLFTPWGTENGSYADANAYTFSDLVGNIAVINDAKNARIISDDTIIEFGKGDIYIPLDKNGKVKESSYKLPDYYSSNNFYVDGSSFLLDKIQVEEMTGFT